MAGWGLTRVYALFDTTSAIEMAVATFFDYRRNLIVPNIGRGMGFRWEIDLLVCTESRYLWEVELKVTLADLKRDREKSKWARYEQNTKIKRLYFCIPKALSEHVDLIPSFAGILTVSPTGRVAILRAAADRTKAKPITEKQVYKLLYLGNMRVWKLRAAVHLTNVLPGANGKSCSC